MINISSHRLVLLRMAKLWASRLLNCNAIAFCLAVLSFVPAWAASEVTSPDGSSAAAEAQALSGVTVLIIRHAEKPSTGSGLSPEGQARAEAYVKYFRKLKQGSERLTPDYIVAADDSDHSQRSRLTVEPLAKSLGLKPDLRFQAKRPQDLVESIRSSARGKVILVCWHHREIPELLERFGADPEALLPEGEWPAQQFGWVLRLTFDKNGKLLANRNKRIKEHLMPAD